MGTQQWSGDEKAAEKVEEAANEAPGLDIEKEIEQAKVDQAEYDAAGRAADAAMEAAEKAGARLDMVADATRERPADEQSE